MTSLKLGQGVAQNAGYSCIPIRTSWEGEFNVCSQPKLAETFGWPMILFAYYIRSTLSAYSTRICVQQHKKNCNVGWGKKKIGEKTHHMWRTVRGVCAQGETFWSDARARKCPRLNFHLFTQAKWETRIPYICIVSAVKREYWCSVFFCKSAGSSYEDIRTNSERMLWKEFNLIVLVALPGLQQQQQQRFEFPS